MAIPWRSSQLGRIYRLRGSRQPNEGTVSASPNNQRRRGRSVTSAAAEHGAFTFKRFTSVFRAFTTAGDANAACITNRSCLGLPRTVTDRFGGQKKRPLSPGHGSAKRRMKIMRGNRGRSHVNRDTSKNTVRVHIGPRELPRALGNHPKFGAKQPGFDRACVGRCRKSGA